MAKKHPVSKLPRKFSDVILVALKDLESVEKLKKTYRIDMRAWHVPKHKTPDKKCAVCFGGAVIAKTFKVPPDKSVNFSQFSEKDREKLFALDEIRLGCLKWAFTYLRKPFPEWLPVHILFAEYHEDPEQFKIEMRNIARKLKQIGQ